MVAIALPLLVSQLLPSNNPDRWSPIAVGLLGLTGALAGWVAPSVRGWMVTAVWVVISSALLLLSWTDLVLDVAPTPGPVESWRNEAFIAVVAAVAIVTLGFMAGSAIVRRVSFGPLGRASAVGIAGAAVACVVGAGLTATAFSGTKLVLQDDLPRVTVLVTDAGIEVTPAALDGTEFHLVFESRATRTLILASLTLSRALTTAEIETWRSGDWAALGSAFGGAGSSKPIAPGQQQYGGVFQISPSPDGTGGAFWYTAELDATRSWPPGSHDGEAVGIELPEPMPWPILDDIVVPVTGS